jgi:thioredoxin
MISLTKLQLFQIFSQMLVKFKNGIYFDRLVPIEYIYKQEFIKILIYNHKTMLEHLTKETFKQKVFNFETNKEWKFEGEKPAIIDFYADWCAPCKMVAPILEELSEDYKGKVDIYKVNTEEERELSAVFGIQSIPSLLFIPKDGQPQMAMGALPKDTFVKAFKDVLKVEKE